MREKKTNKDGQSATRRQRILDAARILFWSGGYDKTSMRDLARFCNSDVASVYYYFRSKEHILFEVLFQEESAMLSLAQQIDSDETHGTVEWLRTFIKSQLHVMLDSGQTGLLHDTELRNLSVEHREQIIQIRDQYENILRQCIQRGIEKGEFRELDVNITSIFIISTLIRSRMWFSPGGRLSVDELAEAVLDIFINGIAKNRSQYH